VILGGGFGGLCTAVSLHSHKWPGVKPEVTLIDEHERFVFKPLMYELLAGRATDQEVRVQDAAGKRT
jgi:demethylphylloquinone reductase